jgi:hypothetical protein
VKLNAWAWDFLGGAKDVYWYVVVMVVVVRNGGTSRFCIEGIHLFLL